VKQGRLEAKLSLRALAQKHRISVWAAQQAVSALDSAAYKTTDSRQPGTAKFGLEITGLMGT
jgi:predicted DNA-binding protein with PD1-like motif